MYQRRGATRIGMQVWQQVWQVFGSYGSLSGEVGYEQVSFGFSSGSTAEAAKCLQVNYSKHEGRID